MSLKTFELRDKMDGKDWTLVDWKPGRSLRVSPWGGKEAHNQSYRPYRRGQRVKMGPSNRWSLGCASVFNWINNVPYAVRCPDVDCPATYILCGGGKVCAGDTVKPRDILVDGDWWYYIRGLDSKWNKDHSEMTFSFIVDSHPHDVPALVKRAHEHGGRQYMGEWKIGPFAVTISHADAGKRKWLNNAQRKQIEAALRSVFEKASDICSLEL